MANPGGSSVRLIGIGILCATALCAWADSPFGVDGFASYNPPDVVNNPASVQAYIMWEAQRIAQSGATWNRTLSPSGGQFIWNTIQPTSGGSYNWTASDWIVQASQTNGISTLALVNTFAGWDQPGANSIQYCTPNNTTAWTNFLTALVQRYGTHGNMPGLTLPIKYWEISNEVEFNFCSGSASKYASFLAQAYATIKAADPNAVVMNGSTSPIYQPGNPTILDPGVSSYWPSFFASGGGQSIDVFAVHYGVPEPALPLRAYLNEYQGWLNSASLNKPIWVTETGTYEGSMTKDGSTYSSQTTTYQASWWVKHASYGLAHNVQKLFYSIFDGYQSNPGNNNWLNLTGWIDGNVPYTSSPSEKPIFFSNQKFTSLIDGYSQASELSYSDTCGSTTVQAQCTSQGKYQFNVGTNNAWVLWNDAGENYALNAGANVKQVLVTPVVPQLNNAGYPSLDSQGNASFTTSAQSVSAGVATIALSSTPVFVQPAPVAAFAATATGNDTNLSLTATVQIAYADLGQTGKVYVAALSGGNWFFLTSQGWQAWHSGALPTYSTGTLANASIPVVTIANVSGLVGTQVYVGYGLSDADMLNNGKYALVYTVH